jgi:hypothetical protein
LTTAVAVHSLFTFYKIKKTIPGPRGKETTGSALRLNVTAIRVPAFLII